MSAWTRRMFLRGAAGALVAIPFLQSLVGRAQAGTGDRPRRIVFAYMPQNEVGEFMPSGAGRSFSLAGTYLEPFAALQSKMIVLKNMEGFSGHYGGHSECLTGWPNNTYDGWTPRGGPSVDQLIASRIGRVTSVPVLPLTLAEDPSDDDSVLSYTEARLAVPMIRDARQAFERVFGPIGGSTTPPAPDATARRRALQRSLLDAVMGDFARVNQRLSAPDRELLDAHLTLLREHEARLQGDPTTVPLSCTAPTTGPRAGNDVSWPDLTRYHLDTIVGALRCDATRVAIMAFGCSQEGTALPWEGLSEDFHEIAHGSVADARAKHVRVRRWQAEQVAYLCRQLDAVPDGDGTLLDNTTVVWLPELGYHVESTGMDDGHSRRTVPAVLVGSCGGYFSTGQFVDLAGANYHNLLLTLVHAMGYTDVTRFGEHGTAPFAQLRA